MGDKPAMLPVAGAIKKRPPDVKEFEFGPWKVTSCKSHILESEGEQRKRFDSQLELPQLPEMVFPENVLRVMHESGAGIEFNALDALTLVDAHADPVKVAASEEWQNARSDCEHIKNVISPFDWTFTTNYKGTILQNGTVAMKVSDTTEKINLDNLKKREPIHFYDDVLLFEDELSDNGTSILNVKVRVMPSCFFILMRLFCRVDNVLIRVNDTRLYHEAGQNYMLREFSSREEKTTNIPTAVHTDPNEVSQYLKLTQQTCERLEFSEVSSTS
ncbi:tip41-like protein [Plakobranchus ocellatus]|uniref:TIP41-like protein n=1 Tax=Plakobranchus ocellatus TaxID=259542 RepID=A0AAV3XXQ6_9GAST|nr:tip41-like protein [Plakobranchus ocellatus]